MASEMDYGLDVLVRLPEERFPEGTNLDFIFWDHRPKNLECLAAPLADKEVIAAEFYSAVDLPYFLELLSSVNRLMAGTATADDEERITRHKHEEVSSFIADRFRDSGKILIPVDSFMHAGNKQHVTQTNSEEEAHFAQTPEEIVLAAHGLARWAYSRERIAIKQLVDLARALVENGRSPSMAVIYGTHHTSLGFLAAKLGANVSREFVTPTKELTAIQALGKMFRWHVKADSDPDQDYQVVTTSDLMEYVYAASIVATLVTDLELNPMTSDEPGKFLRGSALVAQKIVSRDKDTRDNARRVIRAYNNRPKGLAINRRRKNEKAVSDLLSLTII